MCYTYYGLLLPMALPLLTNSMEQSPLEAGSMLIYSRYSPSFMDLKGSLPCSQEPTTSPYPVKKFQHGDIMNI
jgi:hypothetical protein